MTRDVQAETIRSETGLARLAPEWDELWRRCFGATPFQSPAWLMPWWRHFHPGELFTVAVRRGERLIGLAPFYLEDGALGRRLLPVGISLSDYHDVLLDPACASDAGAALVAHLAAEEGWAFWELEELPPDATAFSLPVPSGCEETGAAQSACPVLALPADLRALSEILPPQKRRKLAMARNRAERRGGVAIEEAGPENAEDALEVLFRLHRARWAERGEAGLIDARVEAFQRDALPGLARAGLVRFYTLRIAGEAAASYYGFLHRDRAYGYLTGFDPAFSFESPSVTLLAHVVERAAAEGAREMHFLRGREPYKYEWGAVDRWNRRRSFRRVAADAVVR